MAAIPQKRMGKQQERDPADEGLPQKQMDRVSWRSKSRNRLNWNKLGPENDFQIESSAPR
jgi:hypothetical protein